MDCLKTCFGFALVKTPYGHKNISCDYLKTMQIHMPFNIMTQNCSGSISGKHICDNKMYFPCFGNNIIGTSIILNVFFIFSYIILMVLRYKYLQKCLKRKNMKVSYNTNHKKIEIHGQHAQHFISKGAFFLYLLLGTSFSESCLIPTNKNLLIGNSGEILCLTEGNITVPKIYREMRLSLMYHTSSWELKNDITWACVGGQCPDIDICDSMQFANPVFKNDTITKSSCKSIPKGCFFGRGCLIGDLVLKLGYLYKVYKVDGIISSHNEILHSNHCSITFNSFFNDYHLNFAIVELANGYWLCPSFNTEFAMGFQVLGDLQIYNDNTIIFPWSYIHCGKDWYENKCKVPSSFIKDISKYCENINHKGITALGKIEVIKNSLYVVEDTNINIALSCPDKLERLVDNSSCFNIEIEIWGIREHSTGVFLAIRAFSKQKNKYTYIKNPCKEDTVKITCNGLFMFIPISEINTCNATDKTISNKEYFFFHDNIIDESSIISSITNFHWPHYNLIGTASVTTILWILIFLYICKRM